MCSDCSTDPVSCSLAPWSSFGLPFFLRHGSITIRLINNSTLASVQFGCSVVSDSLGPRGLQHSRLPRPSPTPRTCSNSCWCAIQSSHPCHPLLLLPSVFSRIRVFSNELVLHITWPKYWSFSFSISPSNEYSGLISIRIDWSQFKWKDISHFKSKTRHDYVYWGRHIESQNRPNLTSCTKQQSCGCKASSWRKLRVLFQWTHEWW